MFGNFVNAEDFARLAKKIRRREFDAILRLASFDRRTQVRGAWSHVEGEPTHWWNIPAVRRRENRLATGDANTNHVDYLVSTYLAERESLVGLSLGCGRGWRELRWAHSGKFQRLDAYDFAEMRILHARAEATKEGLDALVHFAVGDANALEFPPGSYDIVLFEDALHHFSPLQTLLSRVSSWLKPDGFLFVNEFVGPARFQWTERQLELANHLLQLLPAAYRRQWQDGSLKTSIVRPSRLRMIVKDPSEAVESDQIMPLLSALFDVVEVKKLGGTIVYPVLQEIAHHFIDGDALADRALKLCLDSEELLMETGEIGSDHALVVCRPRTG